MWKILKSFSKNKMYIWYTFHCWLYNLCIVVYVTNKTWTWYLLYIILYYIIYLAVYFLTVCSSKFRVSKIF